MTTPWLPCLHSNRMVVTSGKQETHTKLETHTRFKKKQELHRKHPRHGIRVCEKVADTGVRPGPTPQTPSLSLRLEDSKSSPHFGSKKHITSVSFDNNPTNLAESIRSLEGPGWVEFFPEKNQTSQSTRACLVDAFKTLRAAIVTWKDEDNRMTKSKRIIFHFTVSKRSVDPKGIPNRETY